MIVAKKDGDVLNIALYFDIGDQGCATSAAELAETIQKADGISRIDVHINSYGGLVSDGWAMYNALKAAPVKVRTYNDGFCCSAAVYPFLAGDERICSEVSMTYLHECLGSVYGYAKDMRKAAEELTAMTEVGVNAFTSASKMARDEVLELMQAETWLSAQECLDKGICTQIIEAPVSTQPTQRVMKSIADAIRKAPREQPKNKIKALWAK